MTVNTNLKSAVGVQRVCTLQLIISRRACSCAMCQLLACVHRCVCAMACVGKGRCTTPYHKVEAPRCVQACTVLYQSLHLEFKILGGAKSPAARTKKTDYHRMRDQSWHWRRTQRNHSSTNVPTKSSSNAASHCALTSAASRLCTHDLKR